MFRSTQHLKLGVIAMLTLACLVTVSAADWPQWRGPNADGISTETGLLKDWPEGGPPVVWEIDTLGEGYSTLCINDGRIYTQGNIDGIEKVIALNEEDGSLIWAVQPEPVVAAIEERIKDTIQRGDKNGDGKLEEAEALPILGWEINQADASQGDDAAGTAAARAARFIAALDRDGDGSVTHDEGMRVLRKYFRDVDQEDPNADIAALAAQRTEALMAAFDADTNGELVRDEFQRSWVGMLAGDMDSREPGQRRGDGKLTTEEITKYFEDKEPGRDGVITTPELEAYYADTFPNRDGIYTDDELRVVLSQGYRHNVGNGPRGMPTFHQGRLYVQGATGDVSCLEADTGKTVWHVNLTADFGGQLPGWGFSESVLITGDMAIVTPGGDGGAVAALNKNTGEVIWRSDEITDVAEYSTAVEAEVGGIPQIVQFAKNGVYGLTPDAGRVLWHYDHIKAEGHRSINITTPIVAEDHVMLASSYGNGAGLAKITTNGDEQSAEEVYFVPELDNHHGGLIKLGDYVYGTGNRGLICLNFLTGEFAWQDQGVGKGSLTIADGMIYMLGEQREMALVEATPEGYREHGRLKVENLGKPSWTHPVVCNGRLYIRNQHKLTAYDIAAN